jgi:hypothetical protein
MATNVPLNSMSVAQKLQLMEDVWASLCQIDGDVVSPQWHQEVLVERQRHLASGESKVSTWDEAKARLLKLGQ